MSGSAQTTIARAASVKKEEPPVLDLASSCSFSASSITIDLQKTEKERPKPCKIVPAPNHKGGSPI